jgi:hypothetical protein
MQARTTRTATLLRMVGRIVRGQAVTKTKVNGCWVIFAELESRTSPVMVVETQPRGRTLADLSGPLIVHVHRVAGVDAGALGHAVVGEGRPQEGLEHREAGARRARRPNDGLHVLRAGVDLPLLRQLEATGIIELVMVESS